MYPSFRQYNQSLGSKKVYYIKKTGCPPCERLNPTMNKIMESYKDLIDTTVFDTAYDPSVYERFNVDATPVVLFVYNKNVIGKVEGANVKSILYYYDYLARLR
jgi:thiol-disulfide isomerase/thioredoxin